jgi:hypothetical protein
MSAPIDPQTTLHVFCANLFSSILCRIAQPVEPFGFTYIQYDWPLSRAERVQDCFGKQPNLFD